MRSLKQIFSGGWISGGQETVCGAGSTLQATRQLRKWLPSLLEEYGNEAELPDRMLEPLAETLKTFGVTKRDRFPVGIRQHKMVEHVVEALSSNRDA